MPTADNFCSLFRRLITGIPAKRAIASSKLLTPTIHRELPFGPYRHLVWFAIGYGFLLFFLAIAVPQGLIYGNEPIFFIPLVTVTLASIILVLCRFSDPDRISSD